MTDASPPILVGESPNDGDVNVAPDANLLLTFDEPVISGVSPGFGTVAFYAYDDSGNLVPQFSLDINDTNQVKFSGNTVTIDPLNDLLPATRYSVQFSGIIKDAAGNWFPGIGTANPLTFTTAYVDPPKLLYSSPLDGASNVDVRPRITLSFDQLIEPGSGKIKVHRSSDGAVVEAVNVTDAQHVVISSNQLTLDLPSPLGTSTDYYITMPDGALRNTSGVAAPGIRSPSAIAFTTALDAIDRTPPLLIASSPASGSTNVPQSDDSLVLTFSEPVRSGTGDIEIHDLFDHSVRSIPSNAAAVSYSGNSITIDAALLQYGDTYQVLVSFGAIQDSAGNAFGGGQIQFAVEDPNPPGGVWFILEGPPPGPGVILTAGEFPIDMTAWDPSQIADANISALAPHEVDFSNLHDTEIYHLIGDFSFSGGDGTVTAIDVSGSDNGVQHFLYSIANLTPPNTFGLSESYTALLTAAQLPVSQYEAAIFWGPDTLIGSPGDDVLIGFGGNDSIDGGPGIDTAVFSGNFASSGISRNGNHIIVAGPDGTDTLTGIEKAQFADRTVLLGQGPLSGDFNQDLNSDILWQNTNGQAAIWTINGLNQIGGTTVGSSPGAPWHVKGSGDFNGDGYADILWQNDNGQAAIWLMNGLNRIGAGSVGSSPGSAWHVIGSGDFNGDDKADILWQNDSGQAAIWLMDGLNRIGAGAIGSTPGTSWHVIGSGDFNGDGKSDILWQNDNGQAAIWLMDGLNRIGAGAVGTNPGTSWHVKGAGDFNGDGNADILWQNDNGQAQIWTMDGLNRIAGTPVGSNPGASWHAMGAGDFNGDGFADILWQNTNGQAAVWTMNGFTQLGGGLVGSNPGASWHVIGMAG